MTTQKQEPLAIASLILACLSFILGLFCSIPAIICGHIAKNKIQKNKELSGVGMAKAGLVIGYVISIIGVLVAVFYSRLMKDF